MSITFDCSVASGALSGFYDPRFERVAEAFERNYRERDELGASVCVMLDGESVVDLWGGTARAQSGEPWHTDTLAVVWSIYGGVPTSLVALRHPKRERVLHETRRFDASFEEVGYGKATILKRRGESDALVAIGAIGSFGYHSRLPILDILGLVDPEIARSRPDEETPRPAVPGHQRWNTASVFAREPKYILIARKDTPGKGKLPAVFGIWSDPALERDYLWDPGIHGYRRRVPTGAAVNDD